MGSAHVFGQVQGVWLEQSRLQPRDRVCKFGTSTAISGDIIVVGAPGDSDTPGFAYAYIRAGNGWAQHAKLTACKPTSADGFGISVAVSGVTAVVGSHLHTAHLFVRNAGVWARKMPLTRNMSRSFGHAIAVDGSTLLIGAPLANDAVGSVYLYSDLRDRVTWECPPGLEPEPEPEPEPESEPEPEHEPEPDDTEGSAWVTSGWPSCPLACGPRGPVTRSVTCTVNDVAATEDRCTGIKPVMSRECETQAVGTACDDGDEQTMGDVCMSEFADSCAGKVNLVAAMTYDVAIDASDVASMVDENYPVDESPIAVELKEKLAATLSAGGMNCAVQDITILSIAAGSLVIDYVVRVPAAVATPTIKAAAAAAIADPSTVGLPHAMMTIELSNEDGDTVLASGAVQEAFKSYAFVGTRVCPTTPCPVLCGAPALIMEDVYSCVEDAVPTNMTLCVASLGPVPTSSTLCCTATDRCRGTTTSSLPEPEPEPQSVLLQPEPELETRTEDEAYPHGIEPEPLADPGSSDHFGFVDHVVVPFVGVVGGIAVFVFLAWIVQRKKKQSRDSVRDVKLPKVLTYDDFLKRMGLFDRKAALTELLTPGRELVELTDMDEAELEETIIDDFELDLNADEKKTFRAAVRELWADERDSDDDWDPVRVVWQTVDADGNGTLGRDELREVLAQMHGSVTEEQLSTVMEQVDTDGSGAVEFDEFERWWAAGGQHELSASDMMSPGSAHAGANKDQHNVMENDQQPPKKKKKKKKKKKHRALGNAAALLAMGGGVPGSILSSRQGDHFDEVHEKEGDGGHYNPSRSFSGNAYAVGEDSEHGNISTGAGVVLAGQAGPKTKKKKKRLNKAAAAVMAMRPPGPPPPPPSAQSFAAVQALLLQEERDFTVPPAGAAVQVSAKKKKKKKKERARE